MTKRMHLAFDLSYIHMDGRGRMPEAWPGRTYPDVGAFEEIARLAARGLFDMLFSGDGTGVPNTWQGRRDAAVRWGDRNQPRWQPNRSVARPCRAGIRCLALMNAHLPRRCWYPLSEPIRLRNMTAKIGGVGVMEMEHAGTGIRPRDPVRSSDGAGASEH
jgi:hypothetical protein